MKTFKFIMTLIMVLMMMMVEVVDDDDDEMLKKSLEIVQSADNFELFYLARITWPVVL